MIKTKSGFYLSKLATFNENALYLTVTNEFTHHQLIDVAKVKRGFILICGKYALGLGFNPHFNITDGNTIINERGN